MAGWNEDNVSIASTEDDVCKPKKDVSKVWTWVFKLAEGSTAKPLEHLHEAAKYKMVIGLLEEGEKFGLHYGGLSCYTGSVRKAQAIREAFTVCKSVYPTGSVVYCEVPLLHDSGKDWVRHNFKKDLAAFETCKEKARSIGWNLYWMRPTLSEMEGDKLAMSANTKKVLLWFEDYKLQRGDDKPTWDDFKQAIYDKFGPTAACLDKQTRSMHDSWRPARKRDWWMARLDKLPDESALVKHIRMEVDYDLFARYLSSWSRTWEVYSEQQDYYMKDGEHRSCQRLYAILTGLLIRTTERNSITKMHGLWLSGAKGLGKTLLMEFFSGTKDRRKKVASDAKGVGRFKCTDYQDVIYLDDIKAEAYRTGDYYQTVNQLLDNTGTEVKVHSSTVRLINKHVMFTSNERMNSLDEVPKPDESGRDQLPVEGHPLKRRVFEIYLTNRLHRDVIAHMSKINSDDDYKTEGDRLMWRWYWQESRKHRFENGCKDQRLVEMQKLLDEQCIEEYNFTDNVNVDSECDSDKDN